MASSLYAGEHGGPRVFRIGRLGFDTGTSDPDSNVFTGSLKTERMHPAGVGGLVNFRRVDIHILSSGTYTFTVKVWVDDERTQLGDGSTQTITVSGGSGSLSESTEEIEISAVGESIQVEVTVDSDDVAGIFLIEGINARGRVIRQTGSRSGEAQ